MPTPTESEIEAFAIALAELLKELEDADLA